MNCNNEQLNFTCGGDQQLYVTLRREGQTFPAELSDDVVLNIVSERAERINVNFQVGDEGKLLATLPAEKFQQPGSYGVEVVGTLNGAKWRAWRKRCIRYTPDTQPAATRSSEQQADPYDITIDVGLVQDITPRRTSELLNDGEDGNDPFAKAGDVAEALKRYAPLINPRFTGYPIYDDSSQEAGLNGYYYLASKNWVRRCIDWLKTQANGIASLVNGKVPTSQIPDLPYIPSNKKGAANGVAELDANRKVFNDQLYFAPRGTTTAAAMDGELEAGLYLVNGFKVADEVLGGDGANGFLLQATGASRGQLLVVGRAADAVAGEQVETYTRRWLPTPQRWTQWHRLDEPAPEYSIDKSGTAIRLLRDGSVVATVTDSNTTYKAMTAAQATAGTSTTGVLISPSVLKNAIEKHTEDKQYAEEGKGLSTNDYTTEEKQKLAALPSAATAPIVSLTHAELVALRDGSALLAGQKYRITDYEATVYDGITYAQATRHPFDIIVEATAPDALSELAAAVPHEGDTYFHFCKLSAWQLKYCIDNSRLRFSWADEAAGKGVVYWMKDEFENEAPFDFKGIAFYRPLDPKGNYDTAAPQQLCHVFNYYDQMEDYTPEDACCGSDLSVLAAIEWGDLQPVYHFKCFGNKIRAFYNTSTFNQPRMALPDIVLLSASGYSSPIICSNNVFGQNCRNITLGHQAKNNTIGEDCQQVVLGSYSRHNVFGNYCCYINLGLGCCYNNVGTGSWNVTIAPYTRQITLHSAVLYANITGADTTTASAYVRNAEVKGGSYGSASANGNIAFAVGAAYPQVAYLTRQGEVAVRDWDGPQPEEPQEVQITALGGGHENSPQPVH